MVERNAGVTPDKRVEFRIGIHLGDVVEESDGDLMGEGVNIAVRVEGICKPGGVCLSGAAYEQVRDRVKETFVDLGEKQLKHIARPLRAYDVQLDRHARASEFTFGSFRLFPDQHLLLDGETPVRLGSRAREILIALVERPSVVVTKDELLARVWPKQIVDESNLKFHVSALRKALGDGQRGNRFITNIPGRGYCFVAPVKSSNRKLPSPAEAMPDGAVGDISEEKLSAHPASPEKPSIAVLPFANMSGDPEQEYFADGFSEDIITALSKLSQLSVICRSCALTFKAKNVLVAEVAESLGVRYVLEGSVRKSGNRVRITTQLIDATTSRHLWAERFDRDLTDIFTVQDDVTNRIVSALALNLSAADRQSIAIEHIENLEAHDCFMRGRALFYREAREANAEAQQLLRRAIALAPRFAPAYAFLASALVNDYVSGWSATPAQTLEEADRSARQAVQLDERNPYALWALGMACLWARRHDEAVGATERAIAFSPSFAEAHITLGVAHHYMGRSEEALRCFERAATQDPYCPDIWLHLQAQSTYLLGRYPETAALLKRRILRNPETDASRALLAAAYGQMGLI
jgi:TolB-like protein/cytochrome c-type biogenesis protein CcmH/NrfG